MLMMVYSTKHAISFVQLQIRGISSRARGPTLQRIRRPNGGFEPLARQRRLRLRLRGMVPDHTVLG